MDWEKEKAEREAAQARALALVAEVVKELGADWQAPGYNHFDVDTGAGYRCFVARHSTTPDMALHFNFAGAYNWLEAKRIGVSGGWPESVEGRNGEREGFYPHAQGRGPAPEITVSMTRTPAAIAQDIARRFLPVYAAEFARMAQAKAEHIAWRAERDDLAARLAAAMGDGASVIARDDEAYYVTSGLGNYWRISAKPASGGVDLSAYVPAELAVEVCSWMGARLRAHARRAADDKVLGGA